MSDPHDLDRFVRAQQGVHDSALAELRAGRKRSHWMWFIFPQIAGLGFSDMARRYAIASLAEAKAYLAHPVLGPRLTACAEAMLSHEGLSPTAILGSVDAVKLRSSLTLFSRAAEDPALFDRCLQAFFEGDPDSATLERLASYQTP